MILELHMRENYYAEHDIIKIRDTFCIGANDAALVIMSPSPNELLV